MGIALTPFPRPEEENGLGLTQPAGGCLSLSTWTEGTCVPGQGRSLGYSVQVGSPGGGVYPWAGYPSPSLGWRPSSYGAPVPSSSLHSL